MQAPRRRRPRVEGRQPLPAGSAHSAADAAAVEAPPPTGLIQRPTIRLGVYAWAIVGMVAVAVILGIVIREISGVIIPLIIAMFPAAVLTPLAVRLKRRGLRDALVAVILLFGTLLAISGLFTVLVPLVAAQIDDISQQLTEGINQLRAFLRQGPFGLDPIDLEDLIQQAQDRIRAADIFSSGAVTGVAATAGHFLTGLIVFLLALFFYLKDGPKIAAWLRRQFPASVQDDASHVGDLVWTTIGSYFRGQLLVAFIDAAGISLGLIVMRVPLALPVGVLVFFGSLFPIVGAFLSGFVAVIIALATQGLVSALIVLGIVLAVQQLEGHILQPLILGRATQLHPLAVIVALIIGGTLIGIVGAFLAVPIAASAWQVIKYLRERTPDYSPTPATSSRALSGGDGVL